MTRASEPAGSAASTDPRPVDNPAREAACGRFVAVGRPGTVSAGWHDACVRSESTILHVDLDAFFAAVEQRDKPSLRGKPVVVGGVGGRGVVATASYEARTFGVHSAMPTSEARRRCPNAAFLSGRFHAYRDTSRAVMTLLREISPLVEPLSLDEAFVDLEAADLPDHSVTSVSALGRELRERVHEVTGGLTGSVGIGTSKLIAKIASDLDKPDGLVVVAPGHGAGPAPSHAGHRDPRGRPGHRRTSPPGRGAHGRAARGSLRGRAGAAARTGPRVGAVTRWPAPRTTGPWSRRARPSRSAWRTPTTPTTSTPGCWWRCSTGSRPRSPSGCAGSRMSGRTVSIKVRLHDFSTLSRSATLSEPSDDGRQIARVARTLLGELDTSGGVRLLGVGVSGLADWIQEDLFADEEQERGRARRGHGGRGGRRVAPPGLGARAWTSCTSPTAAAGSGGRAAGWSRCASRPRRRARAGCSASASATRRSPRSDRPRSDGLTAAHPHRAVAILANRCRRGRDAGSLRP